MITKTIRLHKDLIHAYIDNATFKRVDATMEERGQRSQSASASDIEDANDSFLINEFCDRRDAHIRSRLEFCLEPGDSAIGEITNDIDESPDYVYVLRLEDSFSDTQARNAMKKMEEYIKRGATLSWYINAGLEPNDSEDSLETLLSEMVSILRGQPWGRRPMQPFGPAMFNYNKKLF